MDISGMELLSEAGKRHDSYAMYRVEALSHSLLTPEDEAYYAYRVRLAGDWSARNYLVTQNQKLVAKIAHRLQKRKPHTPIGDLISSGNFGLMHAIRNFDPTLGFRLSTYATQWIEQAILSALDDDVTILLPRDTGQAMRKVRACGLRVRDRTGRLPSDQEIADGTGLTPLKVRELHRDNHLLHTVSLDAPFSTFSNEDGGSMHDILSIPSHEDGVLDAADLKYRVSKVLELLSHEGIPKKLQPILHEVVSRAYGLDGSPPQSVQEIACDMAMKYTLTKGYLNQAKRWLIKQAHLLEPIPD